MFLCDAKYYFRLLMVLLLLSINSPLGASGHRLVSTSPELTELLFQLGKGGDIVGTPQFSADPPDAGVIPVIGPLFMPSIEKTMRLAPDWVLLDTATLNASYEAGLRSIKQPSLRLDFSRIASLFSESRRFLEAVYGESGSATLRDTERCWQNLPHAEKTGHFLIFVWLSPPILAGNSTFISDFISAFGGSNALEPSLRLAYPQVSEDWLALHRVDTVYYLASENGREQEVKQQMRKWWPNTSPSVVALPERYFSRASLTPFHHLTELTDGTRILPRECYALAQ